MPQFPFIVPGHETFQVLLTCVLAPFFVHNFRRFDVILAAHQPSPWIAYVIKKLYGVPYVACLAQPTRFLYLRKVDKETGLFFSKKDSDSFSVKIMNLARGFIRWSDNMSIKNASTVLANGEYIKRQLEKTYRIKSISNPPGAYASQKPIRYKKRFEGRFRVKNRLIKKPYLLITNRHFPQKRFEYAISALPVILKRFPNLSLVITGEEMNYTMVLRGLAKQLSLNHSVVFLGLVKETELKKLYLNASVYLYTAPEEDFGMGIIEAMASGTPVVAWANGGPKTIIRDGIDGYLARPFYLADFTGKILKLFCNQKLSEKMAGEGVKRVKETFSWEKHAKILGEAIEKTANNG